MKTYENIKIAVIGTGYMGQNHARVFSSLANANLVAVCDIDTQKTEKIAKQYKVKKYNNFLKLLENEDLDAISICLRLVFTTKLPVSLLAKRSRLLSKSRFVQL